MIEIGNAPKYEQAYQVILSRLKAGRYPVGSRMPTEGELSSYFNVSRVTIRRALDMLVQDGYVESRQGSGYRVIALSPASDTCLTSFTDAMLRAGREPTSKLLSMDIYQPGAPELSNLPKDLQDQPITRISRLRLADNDPIMLVMTHVSALLLNGAVEEDFPETGPGQSILRILTDRFRLEWSAACEDISPIAATTELASVFDVPVGNPLLLQSCSAFSYDGATVFHEDAYRAGTISFALSRGSRAPQH